MVIFTLDSGLIINITGKENSLGLMDNYMKGIIREGRDQEKVSLNI